MIKHCIMVYRIIGIFMDFVCSAYPRKLLNLVMIRVGMPQKYKPMKLPELPKPQKIRLTKITNCTVI